MRCRHCGSQLSHSFIDLGFAPPSNAYLTAEELSKPETYYPLRVLICDQCWLVQTEDYAKADELFSSEYAYFSGTSTSWLEHAAVYSQKMINMLELSADSMVIEVASNDGYLLRNFVSNGIPCLGIEPTESTARAAEEIGIPVLQQFFGEDLGKALALQGKQADLIAGNNVYAHVPDINDFTSGLKAALKPEGVVTLEFPHLMRLIEFSQFDTIYHEHFSYLSLYTVSRIFEMFDLRVWDVEELSTHGGSLRVYGCHTSSSRKSTSEVDRLLMTEQERGLQDLNIYSDLQVQADSIKNELVEFLIQKKREKKLVAAYGAAAKGNTLLNYSGVKPDLLPFVCDAAEAKQGKFLPGNHLPIYSPEKLNELKPDYVLILPWNIAGEIKKQYFKLAEEEAIFMTAVPSLKVV